MYQGITAIILAGGQGSRMDGRDKGLVRWQGKPLVWHVINRIRPQANALLVSCNRNQDQYQQLAGNICSDNLPGYQGPLAGLQTALAASETELSLVCACDTPLLPADLLIRLRTTMESSKADLCYAFDGERHQYLPMLVKTALLKQLGEYLDAGGRSIKGWHSQLKVSAADFSDCHEAFININDETLLTP